MCGRTVLSVNRETLRCACSYKKSDGKYEKPLWSEEHNNGKSYSPSLNIAPTDITPVLISRNYKQLKSQHENQRILKPMMWGMIPPWHTGDYKNHGLSTNNCRLENIRESKLYYPALKNGGRCVIIVEGFYEWQTTNAISKNKQPYYIFSPQDENIKMDDPNTWGNKYDEENGWRGIQLLNLAGVYSVWRQDQTVIYAYSVITMESNKTLDWLHHRMPAVLDTDEKIDAWLDINNVDVDTALSNLQPAQMLSWYPVSSLVNSSRNKSIQCNKRISLETKQTKQSTLKNWFTKTKRNSDNEDNSEAKKLKK